MIRHVVVVLTVGAALGPAPQPTRELDFAKNPKLWRTHFGLYGSRVTKAVFPDATGVRLYSPPDPKGAPQLGMYSYFAISGDCEVSADYEVFQVSSPTRGYGAGFGFVLDSKGPAGEVAVRRGVWLPDGGGSGVQLVTGIPQEDTWQKKYEAQFFPTKAVKGRIVLRREKAEVVLLTADAVGAEPVERGRVPFTEKVIRELRVLVDSGGSPTLVDGRLNHLRVYGEELTGGIPERENEAMPGWAYVVAAGIALGVVALGHRAVRQRRK